MTDAPRTVWLQYSFDMLDKYDDQPFPGAHHYHHDDVVRELVEALERARAFIRGPGDRCGPVLRHIDAALAKIAQEDKP